MSKSDKLLFLQGTRETTETKPPSFIHKSRETARAQAGLCALHLFSFQDWASSPAGREMSCGDVIVGHSASREWTAEVQLCFSFSFLAPSPWSPLWLDSERPESSNLDAGRDGVHPSAVGPSSHAGMYPDTKTSEGVPLGEGWQLAFAESSLLWSEKRELLFPWLRYPQFW